MSKRAPAKTREPRPKQPQPAASGPGGRPPTVSARWIGGALLAVGIAAAACVWAMFCLVFWQGSWQLLYHPRSPILRTPGERGLAFDHIGFAASEAGIAELDGWWIPSGAGDTVLYFHGASGNMGDTVDALAQLHAARLSVFTFDYRGYGQSHFVHPSEARWREDAESALHYLEDTRHISPAVILVAGEGLGADLALEIGAAHPELAGVILDAPLADPMTIVFGDPRARLVPAHWLVADRWDMDAAAGKLTIPSLWFCRAAPAGRARHMTEPQGYRSVHSAKMLVWLTSPERERMDRLEALSRWIDDLNRPRQR
jgi:uncharacterized protein